MASRPAHRKRVRHYDEPGAFHELTFSCYRRMPLLTNNRWRAMLSEAITAALGRQAFRLVAFVYMPDHVHLLVYPVGPAAMVENLLRAIKRPFSFRIKQALEASRSPLLEKLTIRQRPGVMTFRSCFESVGNGNPRSFGSESTPERGGFDAYDTTTLGRRPARRRWSDWRPSSSRRTKSSPN